MDFESTLERVKDETHRRSPDDEIYAARGIESAIRFFRRKRLFFNEAKVSDLVLNALNSTLARDDGVDPVDEDSYPVDLLRVIAVRHRLFGDTGPWSKFLTPYTEIHTPTFDAGDTPYFYSFQRDEIEMLPITQAKRQVEVAYIQDIGTTFVKRGPENTWQIFVNGAAVPPSYSNAWFTEGQDLIVARCCFQLFMGPYSNQEKATRYNSLVNDAYRMLQRTYTGEVEVGDAVPWGQEIYDLMPGRGATYRR